MECVNGTASAISWLYGVLHKLGGQYDWDYTQSCSHTPYNSPIELVLRFLFYNKVKGLSFYSVNFKKIFFKRVTGISKTQIKVATLTVFVLRAKAFYSFIIYNNN